MKEKQEEFTYLLGKYQANALENEEYIEFLVQLNGDEADDAILQSAKEDWSESKIILQRIQQKAVRRKRQILWTRLTVAASVLVLLAMYMFWPSTTESLPTVNYATQYGETKSIELPDGSKVLLNANSKLTWDPSWEETGSRQVTLAGEAFFDVVQTQDKKSFVVEANKVRVKVLGTSFNVRSRPHNADVFLESGKIDLAIKESNEKEFTLLPGDYISYDEAAQEILKNSENTLSSRASWVNGMLDFQNKNLPNILHRIEELYGVHFSVENPELIEKRMDLSLPYSDWELIKQALEISLQVDFTEQNDTIIVK
ncbi:FecR family protein [Membranihabitans marinus]|uniref:FecR family protein n=1 Tax=Membranihabitans marinus TaxID=1227546 RepID=UPI001F1B6A23|nr:FecR domain-containing protein [Membranihabitans marinus]